MARGDGKVAEESDEHADENAPVISVFTHIEHGITIGIGAVLIVATVLLLSGSLAGVWENLRHWPATEGIFLVVDKLLFVLMLVEILHTIRRSLEKNELEIEPFLIVGLIACVRRILVVTVESADMAKEADPTHFNQAMVELGVLGGLTLVLILSIFLSRKSRGATQEDD